MTTRVVVCGGRDFVDAAALLSALDALAAERGLDHLIEGGQVLLDPVTREEVGGADRLARRWARSRAVEVETFEAEWTRFGPSAGPRRNARMIVEGRPDYVVGFPRASGEVGAGTHDCLTRARRAGIERVLPLGPAGYLARYLDQPRLI